MPQVTPPPPGAPPAPDKRIFVGLDAKKGVFTYQKEKNGPRLEVSYVRGYLRRLWLEWDPGRVGSSDRDSVPARWELNFELRADEIAGEAIERTTLKVAIGPAGVVGSLAEKLLQIKEPDTYVGVTAIQGKDSTLTEVASYDGNDWTHYFNTKTDESRSPEERYEEILTALTKHPLWDKPANRREGVKEPPLPGSDAKAVETKSGDVQPHGAAPLQTSAKSGASHFDDTENRVAFGYTFTRWPHDSWWDAAPTPELEALLGKREGERGLTLHHHQEVIVAVLSQIQGVDHEMWNSRAGFGIAADFLKNALDPMIVELRTVVDAIRKADEEYDPYADA